MPVASLSMEPGSWRQPFRADQISRIELVVVRLEDRGGALAGADAHAHDAVALAGAAELVQQRADLAAG